jgi:hypothetical protein
MTTQVLVVVGGALTGLSGAVFLAAHDVRRVSSSSNATPICYNTSWAVRGINPSTVELFRQVRLEPAIRGRRACEQRDRYAFAPIRAESLADEEYIRRNRREGRYNSSDPDPAASPSAFGAIDQDNLEILLRDRARGTRCRDVRFATELMCRSSRTTAPGSQRGAPGSACTGTEHTLQRPTIYLIAADGEPTAAYPTTPGPSTYVDGPGVLYHHTITAIVELRRT